MSDDQSLDGLYDPKDKQTVNTVLPEHECTAQFSKAEKKTTKAGNVGLALQATILDGECTGKTIDIWINLTHPKPDVVKYGRADFAKIRNGVFGSSEHLCPTPAALLYIPFRATIGHKKRDNELESYIKKYTFIGVPPASGAGSPGGPPASSTTPPATKGW